MIARINWSFAEKCDAALSMSALTEHFMSATKDLGFSHAVCSSHADPIRPPAGAVMMINYPQSWMQRFSEQRYADVDPVFLAAKRQALPFQWSDPRFRRGLSERQILVLNEAAEAGLGDGFTIPLHSPGALPASCSLVIGSDGVDPLNVQRAHWYAVYAHEAARRMLQAARRQRPRPRLSPREKQCLELVGRGKDDYAIGALLGIQQSTAHNTVQRAMAKYGVATRVQAVVRALDDGEITLSNIAD